MIRTILYNDDLKIAVSLEFCHAYLSGHLVARNQKNASCYF